MSQRRIIIGGVVFGYLAGLTYWFPKVFGFKLNEKLGNMAFVCWLVGFYVAFMPLYALGLMGATRRLYHYDNVSWHPYFLVAAIGVAIILLGVVFSALQLLVSIKNRKQYADKTGDPWDGRTLEWSTASPPPFYNFAFLPEVHERDEFWAMKQKGLKPETRPYEDIHMPRNTGTGFIIALFGGVFCFGMIWHILWMIALGLFGIFATAIARSFNHDVDYYVPAAEVERIERELANRRHA